MAGKKEKSKYEKPKVDIRPKVGPEDDEEQQQQPETDQMENETEASTSVPMEEVRKGFIRPTIARSNVRKGLGIVAKSKKTYSVLNKSQRTFIGELNPATKKRATCRPGECDIDSEFAEKLVRMYPKDVKILVR